MQFCRRMKSYVFPTRKNAVGHYFFTRNQCVQREKFLINDRDRFLQERGT